MSGYCDEHDFQRDRVEGWDTGCPELDEQWHTVIYECRDCPAFRAEAERKTAGLEQWN